MESLKESRLEAAAHFCLSRHRLCLLIAMLALVLAMAFVISYRPEEAWVMLLVMAFVILALAPLGLAVGYEFHLVMEKIFPVNDEEAKS